DFSADEWTKLTDGTGNIPLVAVIWLGNRDAKAMLAALPSGSGEQINVLGYPFCFWKSHHKISRNNSHVLIRH
ncbi:MAG: hypothetical protein DMG88_20770, partial [Acidobacteria bacterium]